jgi:hypothetical protein
MVRDVPFCAAFFSSGFAKRYKVPHLGLLLESSSTEVMICTMDLSPWGRQNGTASLLAMLRVLRLPLP